MRQRTQLMNATRGLLAEFGIVAAQGCRGFARLCDKIEAGDPAIQPLLLPPLRSLLQQWRAAATAIEALEAQIIERSKADARMRLLLTAPGIGPLTAHAIVAAIGDAGQFVNSLHREGSNMAMTTGLLAAETIIALRQAQKPMTAANLAGYRKRLKNSYVMKDLRKYRDLPGVLHNNKQFVTTYPHLLAQAADTWFRVDGVDKRTKEREIVRSFRRGRSIRGIIGDVFKLARAVR